MPYRFIFLIFQLISDERKYTAAYRKALKQGTFKNMRIPIMLVGQDRAGKTSLRRQLLGEPHNPDEPSTSGIEVDVVTINDANAQESWVSQKLHFTMTKPDARRQVAQAAVLLEEETSLGTSQGQPLEAKPDEETTPLIAEMSKSRKTEGEPASDEETTLQTAQRQPLAGQSAFESMPLEF